MKKDNLERFVRDNREAFDDKEPTNDLWLKLEASLDKQVLIEATPFREVHKNKEHFGGQQIGWPNLNWRVAASIAVLLLAGCFLYINHQYGVAQQPMLVAASPVTPKKWCSTPGLSTINGPN